MKVHSYYWNVGIKYSLEINSIPRWRTVSARIRSKDLIILNQRLHIFGYNTLNELVSEFINGKFPHITEDRQIDNMNTNTQATDQDTVLHGYNSDFFEKVDLDDMLRYYTDIRKLQCQNFKMFKFTILEDIVNHSSERMLKKLEHILQIKECGLLNLLKNLELIIITKLAMINVAN